MAAPDSTEPIRRRGPEPRPATTPKTETAPAVVVDGVRVSRISSIASAFSAAVSPVVEAISAGVQAAYGRESGILRASDPSERRAGALKANMAGNNKAAIEILKFDSRVAGTGRVGGTLVGRFEQFVLAQAQEQDAEKFSVQETFGQPHLFASGRFIRKYTFAGVARAAAVNHQSERPELATPQAVQLRYFYDKHLRASLQAERGQYTRVIVDGDAYEGWVTTYNQTRDAQNEHWINFVFSMVAFDRYNVHLEGSAATLFRGWDTTARVEDTGYRQPQAELSDAVGEVNFRVSKTAEGDLSPQIDLGRVEVSPEEADSPRGLTFWLGAEDPAGGSSPTEHVVSVTTTTPGIDVTALGVPLHAQKSPSGGQRLVCSVKITDYSRFVRSDEARQRTATGPAEVSTGVPISFTIHPMAGQPATVRATIIPTGQNTLTVKLVSATLERAGAAPLPLASGRTLTPVLNDTAPLVLGQPTGWSEPGKPGVWLPGNVLSLRLDLEVKEGVNFAGEALLDSLSLSDYGGTAAAESLLPLVGSGVRTLSGDDADNIFMQSVSVTKLPSDPSTGRATFVLTVTASPGAPDLTLANNPTFASSVIQFRYQPLLKAAGVRDTRLAELVVDVGLPLHGYQTLTEIWKETTVTSPAFGSGWVRIRAEAVQPFVNLLGQPGFDAVKAEVLAQGVVRMSVQLDGEATMHTAIIPLTVGATTVPIPLDDGKISARLRTDKVVFEESAIVVEVSVGSGRTRASDGRLVEEASLVSPRKDGSLRAIRVRDFGFGWQPVLGGFVQPPYERSSTKTLWTM